MTPRHQHDPGGGNGAPRPVPRVLQFGSFELRTDTGELRKYGVRVRLQMKPFQILLALLEHPGEVVKRDELRYRLWPADTFVDFESGLNTAANRLRIALGDSAEVPRFIETLPRIGYRFIAPVREFPLPAPPPIERAPVAANETASRNLAPAAEPATLQTASAATVTVSPILRFARASRRTYGVVAGIAAGASIIFIGLLISGQLTGIVHGQRGPQFHQIPFANGTVASARFTSDGNRIVYTISGGGESRTFLGNAIGPDASPIPIRDARIVSVSPEGEMALIERNSETGADGPDLLRAPLNGVAPRRIARSIQTADWAPDGEALAAVRLTSGRFSIEYPIGVIIYEPSRWASDLRISPDGNRLAFIEHPLTTDDAGQVRVIDRHGLTLAASQLWGSADGLAWASSGREVWFTASRQGNQRALYAMALNGNTRLVASVPGALRLLDISRSGRVLVSRDDQRMLMTGKLAEDRPPEDLSWYDYSHVDAISGDGNLLLFTESGEAGGAHYTMYIHDLAANTTTRIGSARGLAISPDKESVLAMDVKNRGSLLLIRIAGGSEITIGGAGLRYQWATFFPDGKRLLAGGSYPGQPLHLYTQLLDGSPPIPLNTSTYLDFAIISPDAKQVAGYALGRRLVILSLDTFTVRDVPRTADVYPVAWSTNGRKLLLSTVHSPVMKLFRVDPLTGHAELADSFTLPDTGGGVHPAAIVATPSGRSWVCSYARTTSQLYVVDGWS